MRTFLSRPVHTSWLIAALAAATIIGIGLAAPLGAAASATYWPLLALSLLLVALVRRTIAVVGLVLVSGIIFGLWRGGIEQAGSAAYRPFYGSNVSVQGVISDDTAYGPHGDQRLMLKSVTVNGVRLNGQIWVSALDESDIKRSDVVTVSGKLNKGFGSVSASMFLAHVIRVTHPQPGDIGLQVRDWFDGGIRSAIPEPQASLAGGYLVGKRSALPPDLDNQLKVVGLTHAVVASGYNLTILVGLARQLFLGASKYLAALSAAGMIVGFVALSGLSPSMTRAALVTGLSLAAWYYGRRLHPLVLLPLAAAVTAVINPFYIWGDIGWYLSFTSFAGVIVLAPLIAHTFWRKRKPGFVARLIIDTMSAQIATLPIMIFAFGYYSPYALLANLLVLPLIPLTMLLTFIAGSFGLFVPALAHVAGLPATYLLRYMTTVIERIADLPGAQGDLQLSSSALGAAYAVLGLLLLIMWRRSGYNPRLEMTTANEDTA